MSDSKYGKLRFRIIGVTLAFSLIPLFTLGFFMHFQFNKSYNDKISNDLLITAQDKKNAIDMFIDQCLVQLKNLASTHTYDQIRDKDYFNALFQKVQSNSGSFVDLGVIDDTGEHVAYAGPYHLGGINYGKEEWFHNVMLKGHYISDVFMGFRNFPHFIIAVMRREGGKAWILRATIDSDIFTNLVRSMIAGRNGDAYLVNEQNVLQTPSRSNGPVLSIVNLPGYDGYFPGVRLLHASREGKMMVAAVTCLEKTRWRLVVLEDPSEGKAPLVRTQWIVLSMVLAGVLVILTGTVLVTNSIVGKIDRTDREKAKADAALLQSSKMTALGKMAAGVAHEVNNPLTIIRESAGWIGDLMAEEDPEKVKNYQEIVQELGKIDLHVERARTITHRMLGFARRMEPEQENVFLNDLVLQTVKFLENEALHRNIEIEKQLQPELPGITTDPDQLQQVVLNLLDNAIDSVDRDGTIKLTTGMNDEDIYLSVNDNGRGIERHDLDRIFDPFFTTKKVGEGTGLGLSISYSIIEKLGGRIQVFSEENKGATFTVYLPRR